MPLHLTITDSDSGRKVEIVLPFPIVVGNDSGNTAGSENAASTTRAIEDSKPETDLQPQTSSSESSTTAAATPPDTTGSDCVTDTVSEDVTPVSQVSRSGSYGQHVSHECKEDGIVYIFEEPSISILRDEICMNAQPPTSSESSTTAAATLPDTTGSDCVTDTVSEDVTPVSHVSRSGSYGQHVSHECKEDDIVYSFEEPSNSTALDKNYTTHKAGKYEDVIRIPAGEIDNLHLYVADADASDAATAACVMDSETSYDGSSVYQEIAWTQFILRSIFPVDTAKAYFIEPCVFNDFVLGVSAETAYTSLNMMGIPYNTVTGTNYWPENNSPDVDWRIDPMLKKCSQMAERFKGNVFYDGDKLHEAVYMSAVHPRRLLDFIIRSCTDIPVILTSNPERLYADGMFLSDITDYSFGEDTEPIATCYFNCHSSVVSTYVGPPGYSDSELEFPAFTKFCSSHCKNVDPQHQLLYAPILTSLEIDSSHVNVYANRYRNPFLVRTTGVIDRIESQAPMLICRMPHNRLGIAPGTSTAMRISRVNCHSGNPPGSGFNGLPSWTNHEIKAILRRLHTIKGDSIFEHCI